MTKKIKDLTLEECKKLLEVNEGVRNMSARLLITTNLDFVEDILSNFSSSAVYYEFGFGIQPHFEVQETRPFLEEVRVVVRDYTFLDKNKTEFRIKKIEKLLDKGIQLAHNQFMYDWGSLRFKQYEKWLRANDAKIGALEDEITEDIKNFIDSLYEEHLNDDKLAKYFFNRYRRTLFKDVECDENYKVVKAPTYSKYLKNKSNVLIQ